MYPYIYIYIIVYYVNVISLYRIYDHWLWSLIWRQVWDIHLLKRRSMQNSEISQWFLAFWALKPRRCSWKGPSNAWRSPRLAASCPSHLAAPADSENVANPSHEEMMIWYRYHIKLHELYPNLDILGWDHLKKTAQHLVWTETFVSIFH